MYAIRSYYVELGTSTVVVEPLDNLPLVADLVVNMSGFYERYTTPEMPYLRVSEFMPERNNFV